MKYEFFNQPWNSFLINENINFSILSSIFSQKSSRSFVTVRSIETKQTAIFNI